MATTGSSQGALFTCSCILLLNSSSGASGTTVHPLSASSGVAKRQAKPVYFDSMRSAASPGRRRGEQCPGDVSAEDQVLQGLRLELGGAGAGACDWEGGERRRCVEGGVEAQDLPAHQGAAPLALQQASAGVGQGFGSGAAVLRVSERRGGGAGLAQERHMSVCQQRGKSRTRALAGALPGRRRWNRRASRMKCRRWSSSADWSCTTPSTGTGTFLPSTQTTAFLSPLHPRQYDGRRDRDRRQLGSGGAEKGDAVGWWSESDALALLILSLSLEPPISLVSPLVPPSSPTSTCIATGPSPGLRGSTALFITITSIYTLTL